MAAKQASPARCFHFFGSKTKTVPVTEKQEENETSAGTSSNCDVGLQKPECSDGNDSKTVTKPERSAAHDSKTVTTHNIYDAHQREWEFQANWKSEFSWIRYLSNIQTLPIRHQLL